MIDVRRQDEPLMNCPMFRRLEDNGRKSLCALRDVRNGDIFQFIDEHGGGPWLEATEDAALRARLRGRKKLVWMVHSVPVCHSVAALLQATTNTQP